MADGVESVAEQETPTREKEHTMSANDALNALGATAEDTIEIATHEARRYIVTLRQELDHIEERLNAGASSDHRNPETLRLIEALTARDAALRTLRTIDFYNR